MKKLILTFLCSLLAVLANCSLRGDRNMIFEFPSLQGQYGVGTTTRHIIDQNRQEPHNPSAQRELMINIWYPAEVKKNSLVLYRKDEIEATKTAFRNQGVSEKDINELDTIYTHAVPDAVPLKQGAPFPVVLFSHGYVGTKPDEYTAFCEELASHGFVVVGIAHTYYAGSVKFPDGRQISPPTEKYAPDVQKNFPTDLKLWIGDAQFVIDALHKISDSNGDKLFHILDLARLGMFGHSFGGIVSLSMLQKDSRIKAGISFDQMPFEETSSLAKPFMFIMAKNTVDLIQSLHASDEELAKIAGCDTETIKKYIREDRTWDAVEKNWKQLVESKQTLSETIPDLMHAGFSDLLLLKEVPFYKKNKQLFNLEAMTGVADGFETAKRINEYIVGFFKKNL